MITLLPQYGQGKRWMRRRRRRGISKEPVSSIPSSEFLIKSKEGGNKITVIGGKEVVSCLKKLRDVSGEYMLKLATNAVEKNGLIDASLHSDYKEKIEVASKQVVDTVNAELSESEHSISSEVTGLVAG